MLIEEGSNMLVHHITEDGFKKNLDSIYKSTQSPSKFYSMQDNFKEIILNQLIQEMRIGCKQKIC